MFGGFMRRAAVAGAPSGGGSAEEAEIRALLAIGGDLWTFDEAQFEDAVGLFNGMVFGNNAAKDADPLIGDASFSDTTAQISGDETVLQEIASGGNFTLIFWLKVNASIGGSASTQGTVIYGWSSAVDPFFQLTATTTSGITPELALFVATDTDAGQTAYLDASAAGGDWMMVVVTHDGARNFSISVNNGTAEPVSVSGAMDRTGETPIGWEILQGENPGAPSNRFTELSMDHMLLVPGVMSAEAITWWYNGGAGRVLLP